MGPNGKIKATNGLRIILDRKGTAKGHKGWTSVDKGGRLDGEASGASQLQPQVPHVRDRRDGTISTIQPIPRKRRQPKRDRTKRRRRRMGIVKQNDNDGVLAPEVTTKDKHKEKIHRGVRGGDRTRGQRLRVDNSFHREYRRPGDRSCRRAERPRRHSFNREYHRLRDRMCRRAERPRQKKGTHRGRGPVAAKPTATTAAGVSGLDTSFAPPRGGWTPRRTGPKDAGRSITRSLRDQGRRD